MSIAELEEQNYGEVFTRRWVVDVLLDLTGYTADKDLGSLRLVEPSCGSGAFLGPAVERLLKSAATRRRALSSLSGAIRAYDLKVEHVHSSRALCHEMLLSSGASFDAARELSSAWVRQADFLLPSADGMFPLPGDPVRAVDEEPADVVIGNPPYIRYDDVPEALATRYRSAWQTMRGRGDVFIGFIERSLRMLRPGGRLGFICADRWMRNQYGAALREFITSRFAVEQVWTMHDVDAFEAQVSAYPAIMVLGNRAQATTIVADTTSAFGPASAAALVEATGDEALTEFTDVGVHAHRLSRWFRGSDLWPTGSPARLALIDRLNSTFGPLHDPATGTRVSIGVATGADDVYVTKDRTVAEADRLLPLAMRRDLMTGTFEWQGNYLVNPWADDGELVSLRDYPKMAAYLAQTPALRERFVAMRTPTAWYRTIDKVQADITDRPKLLLQDMKATIHPVLETGGHYPHHNLYYVVSNEWDLEVLGGLLLSRVAQAFIEAYCVRMRGGTLRFQAQYLKKIRVPRPGDIKKKTQEALRSAFCARDVNAATAAAAAAYNINLTEYELD